MTACIVANRLEEEKSHYRNIQALLSTNGKLYVDLFQGIEYEGVLTRSICRESVTSKGTLGG